jgi:glycosyltransferase involved in cell wall biosynthesis
MNRHQSHHSEPLINLFIPTLSGGGAERVIVYLANELARRGNRVQLVLTQLSGPYLNDVQPNVCLINLNASRTLTGLGKLIRHLRQHRPDVIISALHHANVISILATKLANVSTKTIVTVHSHLVEAQASYTRHQRTVIFNLMRVTFPFASKVVGVSQGVSASIAEVLGLHETQIRTIFNPVIDDTLFQKAAVFPSHPWFQQPSLPIVVSVGRLTKQKNYHCLIRAISILNNEISCNLIILGEGEERSSLEKLIDDLHLTDKVALPGFVDNPYSYMKHASVFALSSNFEGLPTVLIEALALGVPIVSTDCPSGPREILKHGVLGYLVDVDNPEALAKALKDALRSPRALRQPTDYQSFTLTKATDNYVSLLNELCSTHCFL